MNDVAYMHYGIDPRQLREHIIVPTLRELELTSDAAISLVLGTAMHESHLTYLKQIGGGPALGLWQMEPATHDDCWSNYLNYRPELAEKLKFIAGAQKPTADHMIGNLWYGCAMARIRYVRAPRAMPSNNPLMLTQYWKQYYNTALGAGTIDQALPHFAAAVDLGTQLH